MLEEVIDLYSIFDKEIVLGISSNLAVRPNVRDMSNIDTGRQVGPDIGYKIPSLAVIAFETVEFNLV